MIQGEVWKMGKDINTDLISAGRHAVIRDLNEKVKHIFEDLDPNFAKEFKPGNVIVAGDNFGCGSSREIAPLLIKVAGVAAVVAPSFARIFYRNAINIGLPIFEVKDVDEYFAHGQSIRIDMQSGQITNLTTGKTFQTEVLPEFIKGIVDAGGLIAYVNKQWERGAFGSKSS